MGGRRFAYLLLVAALTTPAAAQEHEPPSKGAVQRAVERRELSSRVATRVKEGFRLYRRAHGAIVSISVVTRAYPLPSLGLRGVTEAPAGRVAEEIDGTGFVVSERGYIATVHRLVGNAASIRVRFADGSSDSARLAGSFPALGLSILKVDALPEGVHSVTASSPVTPDTTQPAWFFAASSEPGLPDAEPLDVHLLRDVGAAYDAFAAGPMQLAAGAAGGPLLDPDGRLLGMAVGSTFEVDAETGAPTATTLFVQGADVWQVVEDLLRDGCVRRPMLGVLLSEGSNRIDLILPGGPAELAGLLEGDRLIEIDGFRCVGANCVARALLRRRIGELLELRVQRGEAEIELSLKLAPACEPETPATAPLPGVDLELTAVPDGDGPLELRVVVRAVDDDAVLRQVGLRVGDELVEVDGRAPLSFLTRHRFRPETHLPAELKVRRAGALHTFRLSD